MRDLLRVLLILLAGFALVVLFLTVINASETVGIIVFAIYLIAFLALAYRVAYHSPKQIRYDHDGKRWRR